MFIWTNSYPHFCLPHPFGMVLPLGCPLGRDDCLGIDLLWSHLLLPGNFLDWISESNFRQVSTMGLHIGYIVTYAYALHEWACSTHNPYHFHSLRPMFNCGITFTSSYWLLKWHFNMTKLCFLGRQNDLCEVLHQDVTPFTTDMSM